MAVLRKLVPEACLLLRRCIGCGNDRCPLFLLASTLCKRVTNDGFERKPTHLEVLRIHIILELAARDDGSPHVSLQSLVSPQERHDS